MTAEVAVINRHGVALATDSAVSVGSGKIYTSANKLFTLSKFCPVGVMIYNTASFMAVPLETIIKAFREQLGDTTFSSLPEYAEAFLDFLVDAGSYIFGDGILEGATEDYFLFLGIDTTVRIEKQFREELRDAIEKAFNASESNPLNFKPPNQATILRGILDKEIRQLKKKNSVSKVEPEDFEQVAPEVGFFNGVIDNIFERTRVTPRSREKIREIAILRAAKEWHNYSGIVIAGFGEVDVFPRLEHFRIEALIKSGETGGDAKHLLKFEHHKSYGDGETAIIPFAQTRMVERFVEGIDPGYRMFLLSYLGHMLSIYRDRLRQDIHDPVLIKDLEDLADRQIRGLYRDMKNFERGQYVDKILDNLASLPKDELAALAESLVSITSLQKRVSVEKESVGGPIDVAVVSKGDGFIWIQRKHYFERNLNPAFFANYFQERPKPAERNHEH